MTPYYQEDGITIYHGDCRDILPHLDPVDLVLTDPPYPNFNTDHDKKWVYVPIEEVLSDFSCRQLVFWDAVRDFPITFTARHVWHKKNSQSAHHYEYIYEINGGKSMYVFPYSIVNSPLTAQFARDRFCKHPTQKPIRLISSLMDKFGKNITTILDPFMGSGTTLVVAKQLGRKAIGIEIEEKYCEIAVDRLRQGVFEL